VKHRFDDDRCVRRLARVVADAVNRTSELPRYRLRLDRAEVLHPGRVVVSV
jgi:hypothetical protein